MKTTLHIKLIFILLIFINRLYSQGNTFVNFFPLGSGIAEGGSTAQTFTIQSYNTFLGYLASQNDNCVTMTGTTSISGGVFARDTYPTSGKTLGYLNNLSDYTYYIGVNWGASGTRSITTVLDFYRGSTTPSTRVNLPIQFNLYDINAAQCNAAPTNLFIDLVSISAYSVNSSGTISSTLQNPTITNLVNWDSYTSNPITIKGDDLPGANSRSTTLTFSSTNKVHRMVFTYSCAIGNPANNTGDPSACTFTSGAITSATDPKSQHYMIGGMTIAAITCSTLPVELVSFDGYKYKDYNYITWVTTSEINNDYFKLERSIDGYNWEIITTKKGLSNSNIGILYEYKDYLYNINSFNYYRLTQVDYNGTSETFNIIYVDNKLENSNKKITKIVNLMGQEVDPELFDGILIYMYSDGSNNKIIKIK
jgi:hypothetical protein